MLLSEGTYHGVVKDAVLATAKSGSEMVVITWTIGHRWDGQQWVPIDPVDRVTRWSLADGAYPYSEEKMNSLGFQGDFEGLLNGGAVFSESAYMEGIALKCEHEEYQGKPQERWELANWGGGNVQKAGADAARRLSARWKQAHGATQAPPAGRPSAPPASGAPTPAKSQPAPQAVAAGAATNEQVLAGQASAKDLPDDQIPI